MGGDFPEAFASAFCVQDASSAISEKSLLFPSFQGNATFPRASTQMRRLSGSRGGVVRQDVLVAADADLALGDESGHAALSRRIVAKREKNSRIREIAVRKKGETKVRGAARS